jgi:hypothetical protein
MKLLMVVFLFACVSTASAGEIGDLYHSSGGGVVRQTESFGDAMGQGITEIGIERTACFGWCPVYTFIVKNDGTFRYSGEDYVERKGSFAGTVPKYDFNMLAQFIRESGYMDLADGYTNPVTDNPTVYTMVRMNGRRKIVSSYANAGPKELWAIEELIDHLLDKATWN